jgi:hypothetical protein
MLHFSFAISMPRLQGVSPGSSAIAARRRRRTPPAHCVLLAGMLAAITAGQAVACNSGSVPNPNLLTSEACQSTASDPFAIAIGPEPDFGYGAFGAQTIVLGGKNSTAVGNFSTSLGGFAHGQYVTTIGRFSGTVASENIEGTTNIGAFAGTFLWAHRPPAGLYSVVIGGASFNHVSSDSFGLLGVVIGAGAAVVNHNYGIALGNSAVAEGVRTTTIGAFAGDNPGSGNNRNSALGTEAGRFVNGVGNTAAGLAAGHTVAGDLNSAFGNSAGQAVTGNNNLGAGVVAGSTVNGSSNVGVGDGAGRDVAGSSNIAIGKGAGGNVSDAHTVAIGANARATAGNALAIGRASAASRGRAVALGYRSVADAIGTVSVGSDSLKRRIMNVADGINPNDAINLAQLQAALNAASNSHSAAGGDAAALQELAGLRSLVERLEGQLEQQQQRLAKLEARRAAAAGKGTVR